MDESQTIKPPRSCLRVFRALFYSNGLNFGSALIVGSGLMMPGVVAFQGGQHVNASRQELEDVCRLGHIRGAAVHVPGLDEQLHRLGQVYHESGEETRTRGLYSLSLRLTVYWFGPNGLATEKRGEATLLKRAEKLFPSFTRETTLARCRQFWQFQISPAASPEI